MEKKEVNFESAGVSYPSRKVEHCEFQDEKIDNTILKVNEKDESMKIFTDNSYDLETTTKMIAADYILRILRI